jgi:hypothetical protein
VAKPNKGLLEMKLTILKRVDDDIETVDGDHLEELYERIRQILADDIEKRFANGARGHGPMHDKLRAKYDDIKRGSPHQTSTASFAEAWRSLSDEERESIRHEERLAAAGIADHEHANSRRELSTNKASAEQHLDGIIAKFGLSALAKLILEDGSSISEAAFCNAVIKHARTLSPYSKESAASLFARLYEANTEDGALLRKAVQVLRQREIWT